MKYLDKIFDIVTYCLILLCFLAAGFFIIETAALQQNMLIEAAAVTALGISVSLFLFWIKSWEGRQ